MDTMMLYTKAFLIPTY